MLHIAQQGAYAVGIQSGHLALRKKTFPAMEMSFCPIGSIDQYRACSEIFKIVKTSSVFGHSVTEHAPQ